MPLSAADRQSARTLLPPGPSGGRRFGVQRWATSPFAALLSYVTSRSRRPATVTATFVSRGCRALDSREPVAAFIPVGKHECVTCLRCATTYAAVHPACPRCSATDMSGPPTAEEDEPPA